MIVLCSKGRRSGECFALQARASEPKLRRLEKRFSGETQRTTTTQSKGAFKHRRSSQTRHESQAVARETIQIKGCGNYTQKLRRDRSRWMIDLKMLGTFRFRHVQARMACWSWSAAFSVRFLCHPWPIPLPVTTPSRSNLLHTPPFPFIPHLILLSPSKFKVVRKGMAPKSTHNLPPTFSAHPAASSTFPPLSAHTSERDQTHKSVHRISRTTSHDLSGLSGPLDAVATLIWPKMSTVL